VKRAAAVGYCCRCRVDGIEAIKQWCSISGVSVKRGSSGVNLIDDQANEKVKREIT